MPLLPRILALCGFVPPLAAIWLVLAGPAEFRATARPCAIAYAALVLTFIAGSWWGIAAAAPAAERRRVLGWLWLAGAALAFLAMAGLGWSIAQRPAEPALVMLGAAILMSLGIDARLGSLAPRWWMQFRVLLSLGIGAATLVLAFL